MSGIPVDKASDHTVTSKAIPTVQLDPVTLETIAQTIYVLRIFEKEITLRELVAVLKCETGLANAYFLFFSQSGWITGGEKARLDLGMWQLSDKGRQILLALTSAKY